MFVGVPAVVGRMGFPVRFVLLTATAWFHQFRCGCVLAQNQRREAESRERSQLQTIFLYFFGVVARTGPMEMLRFFPTFLKTCWLSGTGFSFVF